MVTFRCVVKVEPVGLAEVLNLRIRKQRKERVTLLDFGVTLGKALGKEQGWCAYQGQLCLWIPGALSSDFSQGCDGESTDRSES